MHSSASESHGEMLKGDRPAVPALIRYPLSAVRYPLLSLREGRQNKRENKNRQTSYAMVLPRRMKRSARGLFLWVLFWYVIAQVALLLWMNDRWALNRTRVEHQKWEQLHERLAEFPDRPLVLILGSSRMDWAFEAGRLNGQPGPDGRPLLVYNFGVPTTGPMHEVLYLNDLLDEGIRPRLLLVEFVTTHLNQSRRSLLSEERFTVAPWLSFHQLFFLRPYLSNPRKATIDWVQSRLSPWYAFRWHIHEHLQGHDEFIRPYEQARQPMDSWGCRILCDDPGTPEYRALRWGGAFNMYGPTLQNFRLGAKPAQAMHDLLARCRREHISVALVHMPITREFRELIPAEGRAELDHLAAELCNRYGADLIDASDWLDNKDFDDGHHVLKTGAQKFTTRMIDELQKLLARTEHSEQQQTTH